MSVSIHAGYDNLIIYGIQGVIHIEEVEIIQSINNHAYAHVRLMLKDKQAQEYEATPLENNDICISTLDGDILYYGIITCTNLIKTGGVYWISVSAASYTNFLDIRKKSSSWQDISLSYSELVRTIIIEYSDVLVLYDDIFEQSPVNKFLMQYEETDWEFIRRMASQLNLGLYPDMRGKGIRFSVGVPQTQDIHELEHCQFSMKLNIDKNRSLRYNNSIFGLEEADCIEYTLKDIEHFYSIGDKIRFHGRVYVIGSAHSHLYETEGRLLTDYVLYTENGCKQERRLHKKVKGRSVNGTVIDVTRGYTKLHLHVDDNQKTAQASWFLQPAFYTGNGGYCAMPEKGDTLLLHFPTEDESDCFIISSQAAPFDQIEGQINSADQAEQPPMASSSNNSGRNQSAGSATSNGASGTTSGTSSGNRDESGTSVTKNKSWTTPGGSGLLINPSQLGLYTSGGSSRISINAAGISISTNGDMDIDGTSIVFAGGKEPCMKIEGSAEQKMSFECGSSSVLMEGESSEIHVRGDDIFLESPRNPPPPELPSESEVSDLLAQYDKEKSSIRPVIFPDGTIMNSDNTETSILGDYFMFNVFEWGSDTFSDDYKAWRHNYYGKNKVEKFGDFMQTDAGKELAADVVGFFNDGADAVAAYYAFKQGHIGDGIISTIAALPLIGSLSVTTVKWLSNLDTPADALKLLDKWHDVRYIDDVGAVFGVRRVGKSFELYDAAGTIIKRTDNYDDIVDALKISYKSNVHVPKVGTADLDALRELYKKQRLYLKSDTIAVGKTNVKGLEGIKFEGFSPQPMKELKRTGIQITWPDRPIKAADYYLPVSTRHAEEMIFNDFVLAVEKAGIKAEDVKGTLRIHQSNPRGVCPACIAGLGPDSKAKAPGIIKQLSEKYPNLTIEITSEYLEGVKKRGRLTVRAKNGKYIE